MSKINVNTSSAAANVPVKIEVLSASLRLVAEEWVDSNSSREFDLEPGPGTYVVRASASSGHTVEQVILAKPNETVSCHLSMHHLSPHETHEWAYLTKPISAVGRKRLHEDNYRGLWLRLWTQGEKGWNVIPIPKRGSITRADDGVSFSFRPPRTKSLFLLQVGGPLVPWKFTAVPSSHPTRTLIRPSVGGNHVHPVDLVVASETWELESLLTLMQRGRLDGARKLMDKREIAKKFLHAKVLDPVAAAVGGYFLLRVGALDRLQHWVANLDDWFRWFPDGAIIHGWQLMRGASGTEDPEKRKLARDRFLEATRRGLPVYTEGLRLLRDGLLVLDRCAEHNDVEVRDALGRIGRYAAIADWSATTTTFTGGRPLDPAPWSLRSDGDEKEYSPTGIPDEDRSSLRFVYDVPLDAALLSGAIDVGDALTTKAGGKDVRVQIDESGIVRTEDGAKYAYLSEVARSVGEKSGSRAMWRVDRTGQSLEDTVRSMRLDSNDD